MASDQGLHCLQTGFSIKNRKKRQNKPDTPKIINGLVQYIAVEESTSIQWFNNVSSSVDIIVQEPKSVATLENSFALPK